MPLFARALADYIKTISNQYPLVTVTGPRQSGKTTLCRYLAPKSPYANLEDLDIRQFAREDPKQFLAQFPEGAILEGNQRAPELTSYLQVIVDDPKSQAKFFLSGSQSFSLRNSLNQSLAGRTAILELLPLSIAELSEHGIRQSVDAAIFRGGFPRIYDKGIHPSRAMTDYIATYIERDLRLLNLVRDLDLFQKFLQLCASRVGQVLNLNSLANDVGISQPTAREWFNLLEASYVLFRLPPYFKNIGKRLIKSSKVYFYDTALACSLLNIDEEVHLVAHPLKGSLFENLVVLEALKQRFNAGKKNNLLFFRDSNGNEVDIIQPLADGFVPIEIKLAATFNNSLLKGLNSFAALENCPRGSWLVCNGTSRKQGESVLMRVDELACNLAVKDPGEARVS